MPELQLLIETLVCEALKGMTPNKLETLISEANGQNPRFRVRRRMLARIKKREEVAYTPNMLRALDTYFGHILRNRPIFVSPGILDAVADSAELSFMIGAKPDPAQRTDVSHWDNRSMLDLLAKLSPRERPPDTHHVLWRAPVNVNAIKTEPWYRILDKDEASVVSWGSSLAALSSEIKLARMFGVRPFATPRFRLGAAALPFYFIWLPRSVRKGFQSAFALTWQALQEAAAEAPKEAQRRKYAATAAKVKRNECSAFVLEGQVHEVPVGGKSWTMYGVIAAQRRPNGNIWVVVSGLAGPATHATAQMVKKIRAELPWPKEGEPRKVLWVPVKVEIKAGHKSSVGGDVREIVSAKFDGKPRIWELPAEDAKPKRAKG